MVRADWTAAVLWMGLWLVGLLGLAAFSDFGGPDAAARPASATLHYRHDHLNAFHQDIDGTYSVVVRALRPVLR